MKNRKSVISWRQDIEEGTMNVKYRGTRVVSLWWDIYGSQPNQHERSAIRSMVPPTVMRLLLGTQTNTHTHTTHRVIMSLMNDLPISNSNFKPQPTFAAVLCCVLYLLLVSILARLCIQAHSCACMPTT